MRDVALNYMDNQAITDTGETDGDTILRMSSARARIGEAERLALQIRVGDAFTSGTSAGTLIVELRDSADGNTYKNAGARSQAYTIEELTAGTKLIFQGLPKDLLEYTKVVAIVGVEVMTAGTLHADIVTGESSPI